MGKGDKKSRRGKITLGTYGVRRPRKKVDMPVIKPVVIVKEKESKEKKVINEAVEAKVIAETTDVKVVKDKPEQKVTKTVKAKKVEKEDSSAKEIKPKKEKKS